MSYTYGPKIVTNGLVLYLDAGDRASYPGSGNKWYDLSGNNNTFSLVNSPAFSSVNLGSLNFNGSASQGGNNQYCVSDNNFTIPTSGITIQAFVKRNAITTGNFPAIFFCGDTGDFTSAGGIGILFSSNTDYFYAVYRGANTISTPNTTRTSISVIESNNDIVHICATFQDTNRVIFKNGISAGAGTMTAASVTYSGLAYIGLWQPYGRYLNSKIYTLQIYNRALASNEIAQNYNAIKDRFSL